MAIVSVGGWPVDRLIRRLGVLLQSRSSRSSRTAGARFVLAIGLCIRQPAEMQRLNERRDGAYKLTHRRRTVESNLIVEAAANKRASMKARPRSCQLPGMLQSRELSPVTAGVSCRFATDAVIMETMGTEQLRS